MNHPMYTPEQLAQSQAPPQVLHRPQLPVNQGQYPLQHEVHVAPPQIPSTANPQGQPEHLPQPPRRQTYNTGTLPQYLPPPNPNMTANHQQPAQGGGPGYPANQQGTPVQARPLVPAPQSAAPQQNRSSSRPQVLYGYSKINQFTQEVLPDYGPPAGGQVFGRPINGNHPTQYAPRTTSSARPQLPHPVASSSSSTQYVPTSTSAGAYPGLQLLRPVPPHMPHISRQVPLTPPPMPQLAVGPPAPHGNVPPGAQNYGQIINGHFARPAPSFNGGQTPQFMPPGNANHQAIFPTKPVPRPLTRYSLQSNGQIDPRSVQGIIQNPTWGSDVNMPKDGTNPRGNSMPPPATNQSATPHPAKRAADQLLAQQQTKKQKTPVTASSIPKPAPVPQVEQPSPVTKAAAPVSDDLEPVPAKMPAEPQHLPDHELAKIRTTFVVEPAVGKPRPEDKTALAWDQAVDAVVKIVEEHCKSGCVLRTRHWEHLRQLTDAIEEYIARPGRPKLLKREYDDLQTVRYIRNMEDGIWDGAYDFIPVRDYDITTTEEKERVVREAWEKRASEYQGPSLIEAQRQIFKYTPVPERVDKPNVE